MSARIRNTSTNPTIDVEFLDRRQAAAVLKITPGTLANLHLTGAGPVYYKRRGKIYYLKSDLIAWILAGRIA